MGGSQPLSSRYSPQADDFSLQSCRAHTIRKANYKSLGNGQLVRKGWQSRIRAWIEGNNADARYRRAAHESSQRISAAIFADQYKSAHLGRTADLAESDLVKARFYRQDNLRFNPQLSHPQFGLSNRDQRAVKISRWAHFANGVTELGAAPTGMLLKFTKIGFTPKKDDKSFVSQLRVLAALPMVAGVVALFSLGLFGEGMGRALSKVPKALLEDMRALAGSFSAISAVSAIVSLGLGASSCLAASKSNLSNQVKDLILFNRDKHLHRIFLLLDDVKNKPNAIQLLAKALRYKIADNYCGTDRVPVLLSRLLDDVKNQPSEFLAKQAMERTLGSYLTERSHAGGNSACFLDLKADKAELLVRENHFLALTNLIEHSALHAKPSENFMDLRHRAERGVEKFRDFAIKGSGNLLNVLGIANKKDPHEPTHSSLKNRCHSTKNILENPHQYGPVTRSLAKLSEGLRVFNHGVLMSLNYQLTRPITWLAGRITESVLRIPNSRTASFSIGRAVASSIWAAVDAFLFVSLAAGNGVGLGGPEAVSKVKFPLKIDMGVLTLGISIISTASQMLFVAAPAAVLMAAAKGACHLEGWEGNVARGIEPTGSKRRATSWT